MPTPTQHLTGEDSSFLGGASVEKLVTVLDKLSAERLSGEDSSFLGGAVLSMDDKLDKILKVLQAIHGLFYQIASTRSASTPQTVTGEPTATEEKLNKMIKAYETMKRMHSRTQT